MEHDFWIFLVSTVAHVDSCEGVLRKMQNSRVMTHGFSVKPSTSKCSFVQFCSSPVCCLFVGPHP